jgi:hypothetical protein
MDERCTMCVEDSSGDVGFRLFLSWASGHVIVDLVYLLCSYNIKKALRALYLRAYVSAVIQVAFIVSAALGTTQKPLGWRFMCTI